MSDNDTKKEHIVAVAVRNENGDIVSFAPVTPMEYFDKYNIRVSVSFSLNKEDGMYQVMRVDRFNPKQQHVCLRLEESAPKINGPFVEGFSQETKEAIIDAFDGKIEWVEVLGMILGDVISGKAKSTYNSMPWRGESVK